MPHEFLAADLIHEPKKFQKLVPPARFAIFGDPISHSRSPEMHNSALRESKIDAQYVRIHVLKEELATSLRALAAAGFQGINITLPHKATTVTFLDEIDPHAQILGTVNTITVGSNACLKGYNTDGPGFVRAISEEFNTNISDLKILILGAGGGAGSAISTQCVLEGCKYLVLANRSIEKAKILQQYLKLHLHYKHPTTLITCELNEASLARELPHIDLIINATSVGMKNFDTPLIPKDLLTPRLLVYDTVYSSDIKTQLLTDAETQGARTANGLSMLLYQGALAFEIWLKRSPSLTAMRRGLAQHYT